MAEKKTVKSIVRELVAKGVIGESDAGVAEFLFDYLAFGRDAVNTPERKKWYENLKSSGCVDGQGRIIADSDEVDAFQIAIWILCAEGLIARREQEEEG